MISTELEVPVVSPGFQALAPDADRVGELNQRLFFLEITDSHSIRQLHPPPIFGIKAYQFLRNGTAKTRRRRGLPNPTLDSIGFFRPSTMQLAGSSLLPNLTLRLWPRTHHPPTSAEKRTGSSPGANAQGLAQGPWAPSR